MLSEEETASLLLKFVYTSDYIWVILPIQDILGLGEEARMNTPATAKGNWQWRLLPGQMGAKAQREARGLVALGGRDAVKKGLDEIIPGM
jgi:4-alpha-glucanotransferase